LFRAEHFHAFTANNEYGSVLSIFSLITKHLHKMVYSSKMNSSVAAASRLVYGA